MIQRSAEVTGINDNLALTLVLRLERHASLRRVKALEAAAIAGFALTARRAPSGLTNRDSRTRSSTGNSRLRSSPSAASGVTSGSVVQFGRQLP
jgi:hypothetical protein